MSSEPAFEESRRLTGSSLYFEGSGAALETAGGFPLDDALLAAWRARL